MINRNLKSYSTGFTLIELLLVLVIILILAFTAAPISARYLLKSGVYSTQDQIVTELRKAQTYAQQGKNQSAWGVRYGSNTVTMFQGNSYATRTPALDETVNVESNITVSGFNEVVFAKATGIPSTTLNITITAESVTSNVILNAIGVAEIQ